MLPLDADNRLRPAFAAAALRVLDERPEVGVVYSDRRELGLRHGRAHVPAFDLSTLLVGNFIDACALLRRQVWGEHCGFDGAMPQAGWEDWDLWIGTAARGWSFEHLPMEGFDYRVRPGSMITSFEDAAVRRRALAYVLAKHRDLYLAHLEEVVFAAQARALETWRLARRSESAERMLEERRAEDDERLAELGRVRLEAAASHTELTARSAEVERLWRSFADSQSDRSALREERENLYRELAAWQERVAVVEGTRAWRLRRWWLRMTKRWRREGEPEQPLAAPVHR